MGGRKREGTCHFCKQIATYLVCILCIVITLAEMVAYNDYTSPDPCVLALDLEGVHDVKLHHPSSSVATSNQ